MNQKWSKGFLGIDVWIERMIMEGCFQNISEFLQAFLQHLNTLMSLSTFTALWMTILDFMDKYMHADNSDLLVRFYTNLRS